MLFIEDAEFLLFVANFFVTRFQFAIGRAQKYFPLI
jgi:hypothetical protein